jgi:hypothetical protein
MTYLLMIEAALKDPTLWEVIKKLAPPPPVEYNPTKEQVH